MTEPDEPRGRTALIWATGVGVVGLGVGGFTLSFSALNDLAVASGIDAGLSFLWPLIVDGFIVVATAAAFALKRRRKSVTWYPWAALILFSTISVIGNSIHATEAPHLAVPIVVAAIVSSVPAIALLVATHLLVVVLGSSGAAALPLVPVPASGASPPDAAAGFAVVEESDLERRLRQHKVSGAPITGSVIARLEGVSDRTGRRRLESLRMQVPDLFETEDT